MSFLIKKEVLELITDQQFDHRGANGHQHKSKGSGVRADKHSQRLGELKPRYYREPHHFSSKNSLNQESSQTEASGITDIPVK